MDDKIGSCRRSSVSQLLKLTQLCHQPPLAISILDIIIVIFVVIQVVTLHGEERRSGVATRVVISCAGDDETARIGRTYACRTGGVSLILPRCTTCPRRALLGLFIFHVHDED